MKILFVYLFFSFVVYYRFLICGLLVVVIVFSGMDIRFFGLFYVSKLKKNRYYLFFDEICK